MQTIYVNGSKIEFNCKRVSVSGEDRGSDYLCFINIARNGVLCEPKDLNQYENKKVEERIEELINKGRVNK